MEDRTPTDAATEAWAAPEAGGPGAADPQREDARRSLPQRWRDLSLRRKGFVVVGAPLLALVLSAVLWAFLTAERQSVDRELQRAFAARASLQRLALLAQDAEASVSALLLTGQDRFAAALMETEGRVPPLLGELAYTLGDDPAQLERLERVGAQFDQQFAALRTFTGFAEVLRRDAPESFDGLVVTSRVVVTGLQAQIEDLLSVQQRRIDTLQARQTATNRRYGWGLAFSFGIGTVGGVLGALLFGRGVTRRVHALRVDADRLARGLPFAEHDYGADEIGRLGAALGDTSRLLVDREAQLRDQLDDIRRRNRSMNLLNRLGAALQSAPDADAMVRAFGATVTALEPDASGALFLPPGAAVLVNPAGEARGAGEVVGGVADFGGGTGGERRVHVWGNRPPLDPEAATGSAPDDGAGGGHLLRLPLVSGRLVGGAVLIHTPDELPLDLRPTLAAMVDRLASALDNLWLRVDLERQAVRDPLTGLYNRRHFQATLERELADARRRGDPLALIVIDIDHFKVFNDRHGHAFGDHVLQRFATLLRETFRARDVACRFGGEEFVLILPGTTLPHAEARAKRLIDEVRELRIRLPEGGYTGVRVSVGVSIYPDNGRAADSLVQSADAALYRAKAGGRDRVEVAN